MLQSLYFAILAGACTLGLWVAYAAWMQRKVTGADALGGMAVATTVWAGGTIGLILATDPASELRWLQLSYFGIVAAPTTFFLLAVEYTGYRQRLPSGAIGILLALGAIFLVLVWTSPAHNLYWADIRYDVAVVEDIATTPGPAFWAFVVFAYGLLLAGTVLFLRYAWTTQELYRNQIVAILVAVAAPWAANVPHSLQFMTADFTPVALSITAGSLWIAMFRYRLTDLGPVALRTVFENITHGVYVLDHDDRVVDVNAAGRELFGVSEGAIGEPIRQVVPDAILSDANLDGSESGSIVEVAGDDDPDAGPRHYRVQATPIENARGRRNGRVVVVTDVTALERQQRQLEAKNERLDQFASVVSHDLRNPLNSAMGYADLVAEDCESEHLENVSAAHERMEALIDDLLTLARHGEEASERKVVDLARLSETCSDAVKSDDATVEIALDRKLRADAGRLRQLVENLLRNAAEHGSTNSPSQAQGDAGRASSSAPSVADAPEDAVGHGSTSPPPQAHEDASELGSAHSHGGGREDGVDYGGERVTVTVGELEDESGFYVEDDGPGIPEDRRDKVFEAGYSSAEDGTGLGLSIVSQIADAHGWDVRVAEGRNGETRIEVTGVEFVE